MNRAISRDVPTLPAGILASAGYDSGRCVEERACLGGGRAMVLTFLPIRRRTRASLS